MLFLLSLSHFELKSSMLDYFSILIHCIRTLTVGEPYNNLQYTRHRVGSRCKYLLLSDLILPPIRYEINYVCPPPLFTLHPTLVQGLVLGDQEEEAAECVAATSQISFHASFRNNCTSGP